MLGEFGARDCSPLHVRWSTQKNITELPSQQNCRGCLLRCFSEPSWNDLRRFHPRRETSETATSRPDVPGGGRRDHLLVWVLTSVVLLLTPPWPRLPVSRPCPPVVLCFLLLSSSSSPRVVLFVSSRCPLCPPVVPLLSFCWCPDDSVAVSIHDAMTVCAREAPSPSAIKGSNARKQLQMHQPCVALSGNPLASKREDRSTAACPRGRVSACQHDNMRACTTKQ